ncbi:glycerol-3-phosphate transporter isoform x1 [Plakobranchus ocellatus]|uniref:Glycerol-3-phosphate transporter isoform x1 n=1 Tax=Plakobranchus ocellatus TaxID=259542 RepID=A0AAV4BEK3_9GAST|nr:glycerol-3-phosphate transporter isoform x1 [Plakobranchus ocellatus]
MEKEDIDLLTLGNIKTGQKSVLTLGLLLVAFLNTPVLCVIHADLEIATFNGVAQFELPENWRQVVCASLNLRLYNQKLIHHVLCAKISRCEGDRFDVVQVKPLTIRVVIKNTESLPAGSNRLDLEFHYFLVNKDLGLSPTKFLVRIHIQGPGSIIKEIKTKNVVEGFASFHIDAPSPGRLFFFRDQHSNGIPCAAETWCGDRFLWRPHPTKRSTSISVTIDTLSSEDVQDYFFFSLNNGIIYQYNLSISTSQYSMSLSKCANFILFSEKYDLPWDSDYSRATANIFVLPPGRDISVNTCDTSVDGDNLAYWISHSRESLWMGNSSSFMFAPHNRFRLIITFDDQKSKMGFFYLFFSSPERRKPGSIYLFEGKKARFEIPLYWFLVYDLHISANSFLFGLAFGCSDTEPCANAIKGPYFTGSIAIYDDHQYVTLDERLLPPVGKDYLELRIYVENRSFSTVVEYYRLLHFPKCLYDKIERSVQIIIRSDYFFEHSNKIGPILLFHYVKEKGSARFRCIPIILLPLRSPLNGGLGIPIIHFHLRSPLNIGLGIPKLLPLRSQLNARLGIPIIHFPLRSPLNGGLGIPIIHFPLRSPLNVGLGMPKILLPLRSPLNGGLGIPIIHFPLRSPLNGGLGIPIILLPLTSPLNGGLGIPIILLPLRSPLNGGLGIPIIHFPLRSPLNVGLGIPIILLPPSPLP